MPLFWTWSRRVLSLVLVLSLLIQSSSLILPTQPAFAQSSPIASPSAFPPREAPSQQFLRQLAELERVLMPLQETSVQAPMVAASVDVVDAQLAQSWQTFLRVADEVRASLMATEKVLADNNLPLQRTRQQEVLAHFEQQMARLQQDYAALAGGMQRDRSTALAAAGQFLTTLAQARFGPESPLPTFDPLTIRPAPDPGPIQRRPALDASTLFVPPAQLSRSGIDVAASASAAPRQIAEGEAIPVELQQLASELSHDPQKIFAYVYNHIVYEPYYGERKGALLTLWEGRGNDVDTASLLIALLRASGISARYAQGTVAIDAADALNWLGNAPNLNTAAVILAKGGVPVSISDDGKLVKEHVWVEMETAATPTPTSTLIPTVPPPGTPTLIPTTPPSTPTPIPTVTPTPVATPPGGTSATSLYLPLILSQNTPSAARATDQSSAQNASDPAVPAPADASQAPSHWAALDASIKRYQYYEPLDMATITGFDAEQWVDEVRARSPVSDVLKSVAGLPYVPSADFPEDSDADVEFAYAETQNAISKTVAYLAAHPDLTNFDLFGGSSIITQSADALTGTIDFAILTTEPVSYYTEIPANFQARLTFELFTSSRRDISYSATLSSLANQRITLSYEAASASDQATIDLYNGVLIKTPPVVNIIPVLRVGGAEVARGLPVRLGSPQTRSMTQAPAGLTSYTSQNTVRAGETLAIGIDYGFASIQAMEASQQRLAEAKSTIPANLDGTLLSDAPGHLAEPVMGEMLHMAMVGYFNHLDIYSDLLARQQHMYWARGVSLGVATQNLAFTYFFGSPLDTLGGGMSYDIQQVSFSVTSLRGSAAEERAFFQTSGHTSSALEHSLWEDLGFSSLSTIRLLSSALEQGIPVYRIDASNKAQILPRLQLYSQTESYIATLVNQGQIVTVSERELTLGDWSGVGFIVMDPVTGASGYLISGGLANSMIITNGGAIQEILTEIAAYAWLGLNMGLDLWGIWAGIGLLLVPEPTLLTKLAGVALIAANLAALGFDVADLMSLANGDKAASQYIGEQVTGLLIEAILKRVGIAAAAEIVRRLGPDATSKVVRQLSKVTGTASDRLLSRGFSESELVDLSQRLTTAQAWKTVADVAEQRGDAVVRSLVNNDYIAGKGAIERVADAVRHAPDAPGLQTTIDRAVQRQDFGYAYELQRAVANQNAGQTVLEYGKRVDVTFQRVTGFDASGNPVFGGAATEILEGDLVLNGNIWIDAKHGPQGNQELRIWNQIQKAQQAIDDGLIDGYRFECSSSMGQKMQQWAAINAPDVQFVTQLGDGFP